MKKFIDISPVDSRYFADAEGKTYLPIGCNLSFFRGSEDVPEETVLETYRTWMTNFAQNGGNFIRIWLGVPFFNVMPERVGEYDERAVSHIRYIVGLAENSDCALNSLSNTSVPSANRTRLNRSPELSGSTIRFISGWRRTCMST